jgi:hypothetical protein
MQERHRERDPPHSTKLFRNSLLVFFPMFRGFSTQDVTPFTKFSRAVAKFSTSGSVV